MTNCASIITTIRLDNHIVQKVIEWKSPAVLEQKPGILQQQTNSHLTPCGLLRNQPLWKKLFDDSLVRKRKITLVLHCTLKFKKETTRIPFRFINLESSEITLIVHKTLLIDMLNAIDLPNFTLFSISFSACRSGASVLFHPTGRVFLLVPNKW